MIFLGDYGTEIVLDTKQDLTSATSVKIRYKKPSGNVGEWTATVTDTTKVKYTTASGDIDEAGTWEIQVVVEFPGAKFYGTIVRFQVTRPLES